MKLKIRVRTSEETSGLLKNPRFEFCSNSNDENCPYKTRIDMLFLFEINEKLLCGSCYNDIIYRELRWRIRMWINDITDRALAAHQIRK